MKILYYFTNYQSAMFQWQKYHIFDELNRHDCHIIVFNPLDFSNVFEANEALLNEIRNEKYDLFMTPHNEEWLFIDTVKEIKRIGIPMILILFDSLMTPLRHQKIAHYFDLLMISQNDDKGVFKKLNSNVIVSHYAANPYYFIPINQTVTKNRLCFPGTPYGSRADIINYLADNEIPVDLYFGNSSIKRESSSNISHNNKYKFEVVSNLLRTDVGRKVIAGAVIGKIKRKSSGVNLDNDLIQKFDSVSLKETNEIYSDHDLCLSIATARNTGNLKHPIMIVHLRNFEIPMSGGVQFCEFFPELAECFEEGKEIVFYRSKEEMIEKARYYLDRKHEIERINIRANARKRAEGEHTWWHRFSKAFAYLGLL